MVFDGKFRIGTGVLYLLWFGILWHLSAGPAKAVSGQELPHFDKVLHFSYFFIGALLLCATLKDYLFKNHTVLAVTLMGLLVGAIDEFHQSFTPERSGNDVFDLLADVTGAYVGACVLLKGFAWVRSLVRNRA